MEFLPAQAPELNPVEDIWGYCIQTFTATRAPVVAGDDEVTGIRQDSQVDVSAPAAR